MKIYKYINSLVESNGYILCDSREERAIVIDPCEFSKISQILSEKKLQIEMAILTHEHYDHICGLNELREEYIFEVLASSKCSQGIQDIISNKSRNFGVYLHFLGKNYTEFKNTKYVCSKADITFNDKYSFVWNSHEFNLFETPGHSEGSICIMIDNKYLFTGDSLIYKSDTITRTRGGSDKDFEEITLPFFKKLDKNIKVFPGHGEDFTLGEKLKNI